LVRVLLKFDKEVADQPITSKIIKELGIQINILAANIKTDGGEIIAEIEDSVAQKVIDAYRKHKVIVEVKKLIEVDEEKCIDCGACYSICPVNIINFDEDHSVTFEKDKCLGLNCGLCVDTCPTRAIRLIG
jgi:NAD-dependent dihydropyrimidine dehydrogenase PreA subunit